MIKRHLQNTSGFSYMCSEQGVCYGTLHVLYWLYRDEGSHRGRVSSLLATMIISLTTFQQSCDEKLSGKRVTIDASRLPGILPPPPKSHSQQVTQWIFLV